MLRLAAAAAGGLCYGESYYFACARHPSPGYFDHPPLSILVATASMELTGGIGRLVLRTPFILLFAGTTWLLFTVGRRLFGAWPGFYAALLMNLAPVFSLSVGIFLQPDGPLMFFWLATVACLIRVLLPPAPARPLGWWAAAGAMLGLAMLSKYTAVLLVAGAGLYVLAHRDQRRWLAHPGPYLAVAIAAALFTPVLVWNARHGWVSFVWQGTRGLDELQGIRLDWMLTNVAGQSLELIPWIWLGLVVELGRGLAPSASRERRFLACLAILPIVGFTLVAAYALTGQRHFHWGMPGYLLLFALLGERVQRAIGEGRALYRIGLWGTAGLSVIVLAIGASHVATGWLKRAPFGLAEALAGDKDPTLECIDFTALERAFAERGLLGGRTCSCSLTGGTGAGKVAYGLGGRMPVLAFSATDPRSFAFFDRSDRWLGKDGILVTTKNAEEVQGHFGSYFARIVPLGPVEIGRSGRHELTMNLYRGENLLKPFPLPYGS